VKKWMMIRKMGLSFCGNPRVEISERRLILHGEICGRLILHGEISDSSILHGEISGSSILGEII
jgi:hypothetical protein